MSTKGFCCMILCGGGDGTQSGERLREHLQTCGIDTILSRPCQAISLGDSRKRWIHSVRMEYLNLRKEYKQVAVIGLSVGGILLLHLADLEPAAAVFLNTPAAKGTILERNRLILRDTTAESGVKKAVGYLQMWRLLGENRTKLAAELHCPALILQAKDDRISSPEHAAILYNQLHTENKTLRYYEQGGHEMLSGQGEFAVCSDVFQFCSSIRGAF